MNSARSNRWILLAFLLLGGLPYSCIAGILSVGNNIGIVSPPGVDLTYEYPTQYKDQQKVIVVWVDGKRLYDIEVFSGIHKVSGLRTWELGYLMALDDINRKISVLHKGKFRTVEGLKGRYVIYKYMMPGDKEWQQGMAAFIKGKKSYYYLDSTFYKVGNIKQNLKKIAAVYKSLSAPAIETIASSPSEQDKYDGKWERVFKSKDGKNIGILFDLKKNLIFSTVMTVDGKLAARARGGWGVSNHKLFWTYFYCQPSSFRGTIGDSEVIKLIGKDQLVLYPKKGGPKEVYDRVKD